MIIKPEYEKKINDLIASMTLEEKVAMCHANSKFASSGVERLGIDELTMSDGPHGVRGEVARHSWTPLNLDSDFCTYLPTGTALAATFNPNLGRLFGEVLGDEARFRNKDIILGPGVNIIRTPLCGRNFEYMSEDPCLTEKIAPELVRGIESKDTAACVKHYCLNNQEMDRGKVNVEVSRRALYEIYLRGFYAAIIEGGASSVMGAYNRYGGQHCCHNDYLVNKVLKDKWGFEGVYLTDWAGAHDTEECIFNGLDIEMGTNGDYKDYYLADAFLKRAKESEEVRALLDDKVRRILRLMFSIKKHDSTRNKGSFNTPENQAATAAIAEEAMVLLKNEDSILPLKDVAGKNVLVIGYNAEAKHAAGGNSSGVRAKYEVSLLEGIRNYLDGTANVEYVSDIYDLKHHPVPVEELNILNMEAGNRSCEITAVTHTENGDTVETTYNENMNIRGGKADIYKLKLSATVKHSGIHALRFSSNSNAKINVKSKGELTLLCPKWDAVRHDGVSYEFEAGEKFEIEVEVTRFADKDVNFEFGWLTPYDYKTAAGEQYILDKAAAADIVIYCAGLGHSYDTEGFDRKDMKLPASQQTLIPKVLGANKNTVVTITAGSPVEMPWIDDAKAVLWTWYAGMESGNVLARILFGKVSPSGKLPFTLPKVYEDHPVFRYGEYQCENCKYNDDIWVGYRAFDRDGIEPLFPFGHGLSYVDFEYSNLKITPKSDGVDVTFDITNKGYWVAKEAVQLYVGYTESSVERPVRELRDFEKVELDRGESATVRFTLTKKYLSYFDEAVDDFVFESGEFIVEIGSSSRDIRLSGKFTM